MKEEIYYDVICDFNDDSRSMNEIFNIYEKHVSQIADKISREHLMTIEELKQRGLIKDD